MTLTQLVILLILMVVNAGAICAFMRNTEYEMVVDDRPQYGFAYKQFLWKVKYYSLKYFGEFWTKPVCTCPLCMASLHSTYFFAFFYFTFGQQQIQWLAFYPMYILALSFTAHVTNLLTNKLEN